MCILFVDNIIIVRGNEMLQDNILTKKLVNGALGKKIRMSLNFIQPRIAEICGISKQEVTLSENDHPLKIRTKKWLASSEGILAMGIVITTSGLLLTSWHKEWVIGFIFALIIAPVLIYQAGRKAVSEEINRESLEKHFEELAGMVHRLLCEVDEFYYSSTGKELDNKLTTLLKKNLELIQHDVIYVDYNRMQKFLIPHLEAVSTIIKNYGLEKAITDYPHKVVEILHDLDWKPTLGAEGCPEFAGTCPFCEKMV